MLRVGSMNKHFSKPVPGCTSINFPKQKFWGSIGFCTLVVFTLLQFCKHIRKVYWQCEDCLDINPSVLSLRKFVLYGCLHFTSI